MMITDDLNQLAMDAKACDAAKAELAGINLELLQRTAKVRPDRYGFTQLDDLLQNVLHIRAAANRPRITSDRRRRLRDHAIVRCVR